MSSRRRDGSEECVHVEGSKNSHNPQNHTWTPSNPLVFRDAPAKQQLSVSDSSTNISTKTETSSLDPGSGSCRLQHPSNRQIWTPQNGIRFQSLGATEHLIQSHGSSRTLSKEEESHMAHGRSAENTGSSKLQKIQAHVSQPPMPHSSDGRLAMHLNDGGLDSRTSSQKLDRTLPRGPFFNSFMDGFQVHSVNADPKFSSSEIVHSSVPLKSWNRNIESAQFHTVSDSEKKLGFGQKNEQLTMHVPESSKEIQSRLFEQQKAAQEEEDQQRAIERIKKDDCEKKIAAGWVDRRYGALVARLERVCQDLRDVHKSLQEIRVLTLKRAKKYEEMKSRLAIVADALTRSQSELQTASIAIQHLSEMVTFRQYEEGRRKLRDQHKDFSLKVKALRVIIEETNAVIEGLDTNTTKRLRNLLQGTDPGISLRAFFKTFRRHSHYLRLYQRLRYTNHFHKAFASLNRSKRLMISMIKYRLGLFDVEQAFLNTSRSANRTRLSFDFRIRSEVAERLRLMTDDAEIMWQIIRRDLGAFGASLPVRTHHEEWSRHRIQQRRFRRLFLYLFYSSRSLGELSHIAYGTPYRILQDRYEELSYIQRELHMIAEQLVVLSWVQSGWNLVEQNALPFDQNTKALFRYPLERRTLTPRPTYHPKTSRDQEFWQFDKYQGADGRRIAVHVCSSDLASERVARLFSQDSLLGLDLEWRPGAPKGHSDNVCLVQVANFERIGLFHVALSNSERLRNRIPPTLRAILEDRNIRKVGVGIKGDGTRLRNILDVSVKGLFELSHLYRLLEHRSDDRNQVSKRLVSLTTQAEKYLGLPLPKGSVRTSEWHKPLNHEQVFYSANDAYASLMLFYTMDQKRKTLDPTPPLPRLVEDNYPIQTSAPDNSGSDANESEDGGAIPLEISKLYDNKTAKQLSCVDLEDSTSLIIDGDPFTPMSYGTLRNMASLAVSFAASNWRKVLRNNGTINSQHLQVYYLAQRHGRSFNDISLALRVKDPNQIARSLFSLSKATDLRLSENLYSQVRLNFCLSDRLDSLSNESVRSLVSNERDRISAQEWARTFPNEDQKYLQAYYLWHYQQQSLESIAVTLEQNYKLVADMIFFCFSCLEHGVGLSSEQDVQRVRDVLRYARIGKAESWWKDYMKPRVKRAGDSIHLRSWGDAVSNPFPQRLEVFKKGAADAIKKTRSMLDKLAKSESFTTILATGLVSANQKIRPSKQILLYQDGSLVPQQRRLLGHQLSKIRPRPVKSTKAKVQVRMPKKISSLTRNHVSRHLTRISRNDLPGKPHKDRSRMKADKQESHSIQIR